MVIEAGFPPGVLQILTGFGDVGKVFQFKIFQSYIKFWKIYIYNLYKNFYIYDVLVLFN